MSCDLDGADCDGPAYRLGRGPDPWAWPDWSRAHLDGTFRNRWDDPDGDYRVLYASSQRLGAFVETLARFRPDLEVVAALAAIDGSDGRDGDPLRAGTVPLEWVERRRLGVAELAGRYAVIGNARSLRTVRSALAASAVRHHLTEIDAATIRLTAPRAFTQQISRLVYGCVDDRNGPFAGIRYASRLGDDFENWALFEPTASGPDPLCAPRDERITGDDPDLLRAAALLGLRLE
ncbi:MAG: RES domain-containing protein [Dehalococcoidia bacterium]